MRRAHEDDEHGGEPEVRDGHGRSLARRDRVVLLRLGRPPVAPAVPELEAADHEDQDQDRVRRHDHQRRERDQPDEPERGVERRDRATAVERDDRQQVEEVEEEPDVRHRGEEVAFGRDPDDPERERAERADVRAGEREARLAPDVVRDLLQRDQGAEERDEHRRARLQPLAAGLEHVPELVDEEEQDEADREPPAPEQRVGRDRDEPGERRPDELELEDRERGGLELPEQRAEERERHPQPANDELPRRLGVDRLVVAQVREVVLVLAALVRTLLVRTNGPLELVGTLRLIVAHRLVVADGCRSTLPGGGDPATDLERELDGFVELECAAVRSAELRIQLRER